MEPKTNVLIALESLLKHNSSILTPVFRSNAPTNAAGDSLEYFMKDIFCNTSFQYQYAEPKEFEYKKYLSWTGNPTNFPDFIVRDGIGVEPKKLSNLSHANLSLNSSYPKDYIYPDSQNLPKPENINEPNGWSKKAILYAVGNCATKSNKLGMSENKLITLWLAFGNTFVADKKVYLDIIKKIRTAIASSGIALAGSKELARAINIDPLKNTNLRARSMFELRHPADVFKQYITKIDRDKDNLGNVTRIYLVMLKSDYDTIPNKPTFKKFFTNGQLYRTNIKIDNPNNINQKLDAILFEAYTN